MDTKGEKMKYKYSRKQIAEEFVYKSDSVNGASLLGMLQALADKPKEECKHREVWSAGDNKYHCFDCGKKLPTPLKPKPEIEKINEKGIGFEQLDDIYNITRKVNEIIDYLSTEGKKEVEK